MAAEPQCQVDFSDSDFLVSQLEGKVRLSQINKAKAGAPEAASPAEMTQPQEEDRLRDWRPVVGKLLVLIPFGLLVGFLLASR